MYRSSMSFCNPAGDSQSKAYTALGTASGLVNTIETLEEIWKMLMRNTYTSVLNLQLDLARIHPPTQSHLPARWRISNSVATEVKHELQQEVLVPPYGYRRARVKLAFYALLNGSRADLLENSSHDLSNVHVFKSQRDLSSICTSRVRRLPARRIRRSTS